MPKFKVRRNTTRRFDGSYYGDPILTTRISREIMAQLEARCAAAGVSRRTFVENLLTRELAALPAPATAEEVEALIG